MHCASVFASCFASGTRNGPGRSAAVGARISRRGFTLIELLVVMAIMAILLATTVSSITAILAGYAISTNADQVISTINLARQDALSLNENVYVVFFETTHGSQVGTSTPRFRALQLYREDVSSAANGSTLTFAPMTKPVFLTGTIVIDDSIVASTLFDTTPSGSGAVSSLANFTTPPQLGANASYVAFCCRPNGGTNLNVPATTAYPSLLLCDLKKLPNPGTLPTNYALIQVNPVNGIARSFRP